MDKIRDIIIIGGGPAGYSAALYAARSGLDTLVIEKMSAGGQMNLTGSIDNYPGFDEGIEGFELSMKMQQGAEKYGAVTEYAEVNSIENNCKIKTVNTDSGSFSAKTVIIATGAYPRTLGIPKEEEFTGRGIHYCAHCDGRFYKDKTVIVVGGGNSAAEDALYLSTLAKKVYLVHRRDTLRAEKMLVDALYRTENIKLILNSVVKEIMTDKRVTAVIINNTENDKNSFISCDGVFISIGRKPATDFIEDRLKDKNGYIIADESTKTEIPGIFAAGDVRTKALRQIVTAVSDGATAVHFARDYINTTL